MAASSPDWRIWLGLSLTISWLLLGALHITQDIGWSNFTRLPAAELGSFLEGAFAPLAFLWLVIGYFLQQKELQQNTLALRAQASEIQRTAEQAIIQSEQMAASERHARQDAFLQITRTVRAQLGTIAGLLYVSSHGATADGTSTASDQNRLFGELGQDVELFSRRLINANNQAADDEAAYQLFYGTLIRARHSNNFIFTFERLLEKAREVEPDEMIRDALLTSGHGFVYLMAKRHQAKAPAELADYSKTGRHINM